MMFFVLDSPADATPGDLTAAAALGTFAVVFALHAIVLWAAAWVTLISTAH